VVEREGYSEEELGSWRKDMDGWELLDETFRVPLRSKWRELRRLPKNGESELVKTLFKLGSLSHGISNAASHMIGYLVQEFLDVHDADPEEHVYERLASLISAAGYKKYKALLQKCSCTDCQSVLEYDQSP